MLYNIHIKFKDGTVTEFPRKSNIKPINSDKLNDKIEKQIFPAQWEKITSTPVY